MGMELDYYHHRVVSRVAERLEILGSSEIWNFKKISEMFGFDGEYPAAYPKAKF